MWRTEANSGSGRIRCKPELAPRLAEQSSLVSLTLRNTLIGDAACKSDADCRAIAFGDKPCGGPWSYKIYSVTSVDTVEVWWGAPPLVAIFQNWDVGVDNVAITRDALFFDGFETGDADRWSAAAS